MRSPATVDGGSYGVSAWRDDPVLVPDVAGGVVQDSSLKCDSETAAQDQARQRLRDRLAARFGREPYPRILRGRVPGDSHAQLVDAGPPDSARARDPRGDSTQVQAVASVRRRQCRPGGEPRAGLRPDRKDQSVRWPGYATWPSGSSPRSSTTYRFERRVSGIVGYISVCLVTRHNTDLAGATRSARQNTGQIDEQQ